MPPRIPVARPPALNTITLCLRPSPASVPVTPLPFIQTASLSDATRARRAEKKRMSKQEPYRWSQIQQRKNAHLEQRKSIDAIRNARRGDPVRGITTPYVESFDSAGQAPFSNVATDNYGNALEEAHELPTSTHLLNNLVSKQELDEAIQQAYLLTKPLESVAEEAIDPALREEEKAKHEAAHQNAVEALHRILSLSNASAKDKKHVNIQRVIETFGRHNTDSTVRQKPLARGQEKKEVPTRAGPDTGSTEVQIGLLTMKIRLLANELERGRGYKDKVGYRDLRLLVHRRQKLLRYMEKKERGSGRWQHVVETLGLGPAAWKGQITL